MILELHISFILAECNIGSLIKRKQTFNFIIYGFVKATNHLTRNTQLK